MNALDFYAQLADLLDCDTCTAETCFRDLPSWTSLSAFEVVCFLASDYGVVLESPLALKPYTTCQDLFNLANQE